MQTLSTLREHLQLAAALLETPPTVEGDVIECGCYEGGSTVNLSLVCSLTNRRLVVCDSFQGLPRPNEEDRVHYSTHVDHYDTYEEGRFAASLDLVRSNLAKYGSIEACDFVAGYFEDTLSGLDRKYVLAFLDVDLIASLKPCILGIWPNLREGCKMFVHEARSIALVSVFFDSAWWRAELAADPPGFVGAGTGLPLELGKGSELGYVRKEGPPGVQVAWGRVA